MYVPQYRYRWTLLLIVTVSKNKIFNEISKRIKLLRFQELSLDIIQYTHQFFVHFQLIIWRCLRVTIENICQGVDDRGPFGCEEGIQPLASSGMNLKRQPNCFVINTLHPPLCTCTADHKLKEIALKSSSHRWTSSCVATLTASVAVKSLLVWSAKRHVYSTANCLNGSLKIVAFSRSLWL